MHLGGSSKELLDALRSPSNAPSLAEHACAISARETPGAGISRTSKTVMFENAMSQMRSGGTKKSIAMPLSRTRRQARRRRWVVLRMSGARLGGLSVRARSVQLLERITQRKARVFGCADSQCAD